jgi:hypothetical protein
MKEIFEKIIKQKKWSQNEIDNESPCGPGSSIRYTENLRSKLPLLIEQFNIKTIIDAPCGDFNWMKLVIPMLNVEYIGGDIVPELIKSNRDLYKINNVRFEEIDITTDTLPEVDLMICRDCLFHLSDESIYLFLNNFVKSNIKYLLTTTHYNEGRFNNYNIDNGRFRLLDLFSSPFNIDNNVLYQIDDWIDNHPPRGMVLFSREQIQKCI